jgi:hypothetical protein
MTDADNTSKILQRQQVTHSIPSPATASTVDFTASDDSLLRGQPLDYAVLLPVLGIALRFETNSRYVLGVVEEAFGGWRAIADSADLTTLRALRVQVVIFEGSESSVGHAPVRHFCPDGSRVLTHSPGSVATVDPPRGEALAYVTTDLAGDRAHFRETMLEAITLALVTHYDRHPIHAAAIARNGRAVLLAGPSGSGKSTLAYMAHAAGIDVLSDDKVWVQREPAFRLWGWPHRVNLLPDAPSFFPELGGVGSSLETNGTRKLAVDLGGAPAVHRFAAASAVVCLVRRGGPVCSLERLATAPLVDALTRHVTPGFDRYPERLHAAVDELTRNGGWRLTLSNDPHEALPYLERMLEEEVR